jgi:hypothetical protein
MDGKFIATQKHIRDIFTVNNYLKSNNSMALYQSDLTKKNLTAL